MVLNHILEETRESHIGLKEQKRSQKQTRQTHYDLKDLNDTYASEDMYNRPIMCLLTGDGNRNEGRPSFIEMAETALKFGFNLEVWAFKESTSRNYNILKSKYSPYVEIMDLSKVVDRITKDIEKDNEEEDLWKLVEMRARKEANETSNKSRSKGRSRGRSKGRSKGRSRGRSSRAIV